MNHDLQSFNSNPGRKNLFRNEYLLCPSCVSLENSTCEHSVTFVLKILLENRLSFVLKEMLKTLSIWLEEIPCNASLLFV